MDLKKSLTSRRGNRLLSILVILWLLTSTACNFSVVPGQPTDTPVPTLQPTPAPAQAASATPRPQPTPSASLPPALVESTPVPETEIGLRQPWIFYFNQAMDKSSVESAVVSQPAVAGSFKWLNDSTVSFTPGQPLPKDTDLVVSVSIAAKAANGLAMTAPVQLAYHTAAGFQAVERLPLPGAVDVDPASAVVVTFNHPVVALGADPASLPAAFTLDPAVNGQGEWLNTSTYLFHGAPGLSGGAGYTVRLNRELAGVDGAGWAAADYPDWTFTTARPKILEVTPPAVGKNLFLDASITVKFNQAMDDASVRKNFSLSGPQGAVPGKFSWDAAGLLLTFTPDALLQRGADYYLTLPAQTLSHGGAQLVDGINLHYLSIGGFSIYGSQVPQGGTVQLANDRGSLFFSLTSPVVYSPTLNKAVSFDPAVTDFSVSTSSDGLGLYIFGSFDGRTQYTMTLSGQLADKWGSKLAEPYVYPFKTSALVPALSYNLAQSWTGIAFLTPNDVTMPGRVTNLKTLKISTGPVDLASFAEAMELQTNQRDSAASKITSFNKTLKLAADKNVAVDLPVTSNGKALAPGLYYYDASSPDFGSTSQAPGPLLLVVSRVQLTLKMSTTQLMAWAVNLDTNQPLAGAALAIYQNDKGSLVSLGTIKTNAQGTGTLDFSANMDVYSSVYAVTGKPGDANFSLAMTSWNQGVNAWELGIPSGFNDATPQVYLYTDRPIYRPGQTVNFKAILRKINNGRYSIPDLNQLNLQVLGAYSAETNSQALITKIPLNLSEFGTGTASFVLPDNAAPGYYSLQVDEPQGGNLQGASLSFQVAEYRKPEIELTASFSTPEMRAGQDVNAAVKAQYYFGAAAGSLNISWSLYARTNNFYIPGNYQTGIFNPNGFMPSWMWMTGSLGDFITSGAGTTGADGSLALHIPAADLAAKINLEQPRALILEVSYQGVGDFPVSSRAEMTLHPADFYIGVRPEAWSGQANIEMGFMVQTVGWKNSPSSNHTLQAAFKKVIWTVNPAWRVDSNEPYYTLQYEDAGKSDFRTDGQGQARLVFTPPSAGTYLLDASGEGAHTQVLVWVSGQGSSPWPALPNQSIHLTLDADSYQAGQTAKLFIPNPLAESKQDALALITVERSKVMRSEVVTITGTNLTYSLPLGELDAPNVFVSVVLIGKTAAEKPDFRVGYIEVKVDPAALKLNVEVLNLPEKAGPGTDLKFNIRVKIAAGNPVQGEFSAALVDKAVLALADPNAPDILNQYYAEQPLGVMNSLSLSVYSQRLVLGAPGRGGGGGGSGEAPSVRELFKDTAYWNGQIVTDAAGMAEISAKLPDNLTTWVLTLRGITKDSRVGEAVKEIVTTRDLLVRPFTPRFLVVGDHIQLSATIQNNTAGSLTVEAALQATGVDLDDPRLASQMVDVPANGRQSVSWWVRVQDVDKADLLFSAKSGSLEDAARPELGSLPIEAYSTVQSFGTSGILAAAGERLEVISVPQSFTPTGGEFRLEMAPSLAAAVLDGLKAMDSFPADFTEPVLSRLLPNLATFRTLQSLNLDAPNLKEELQAAIQDGMSRMANAQNVDGGWGWSAGHASDPLISAYALYILSQATQTGLMVDANCFKKAQEYLTVHLIKIEVSSQGWELDRLAFQVYALQSSGAPVKDAGGLYPVRARLSSSGQAMLAMVLQQQNPADERVRTILSDLGSKATRSATGAAWEAGPNGEMNFASANYTTAVVLLALARLDPTSPLVTDAVRQLVAHRRTTGAWASSYETAWVLLSLTETLKGSSDLQASFAFSASLNNSQLAKGQAGGAGALNGVEARIPLSDLRPSQPNDLVLSHGSGDGKLYYRAFLQVNQPVESAQPLQRGISISRVYNLPGQDCVKNTCPSLESIRLGDTTPTLLVRLTVTIPKQMYYVVVEDFIPAGSEIVNVQLNTTQLGDPTQKDFKPTYDPANPFGGGWNYWWFGEPQIYDNHIRWVGTNLAAGTYELTYRISALQAGEYRVIPAHAFQYYFPDVEGTSRGSIFKIVP